MRQHALSLHPSCPSPWTGACYCCAQKWRRGCTAIGNRMQSGFQKGSELSPIRMHKKPRRCLPLLFSTTTTYTGRHNINQGIHPNQAGDSPDLCFLARQPQLTQGSPCNANITLIRRGRANVFFFFLPLARGIISLSLATAQAWSH